MPAPISEPFCSVIPIPDSILVISHGRGKFDHNGTEDNAMV